MTFLEQSEVQRIGDAIGLKGRFLVDWGTDDIINTLCPIPQTETVEVKHFAIYRDGFHVCTQLTIDDAENYVAYSQFCSDMTIVELTGAYERPVKPKVKRRLEITDLVGCGNFTLNDVTPPKTAKVFAEWEE